MNIEVFGIAPTTSRAMWLLAVVPAVLLVVFAVGTVVTLKSARASRFEVSSEGLRLRGGGYGRTIAAEHLRLPDIRRLDLDQTPELQPRWRTMGTGMPGYSAGWFRLRNGERALLYLTDRSRAVYIPTSLGYSVLLSPSDPEGLVDALRRLQD